MGTSLQQSVWQLPLAVLAALGAVYSIWWAWLGEPDGHWLMIFGLAFATPFLIAGVLLIVRLTPERGRVERMRRTLFTVLTGIACVGTLQVPGFMAAIAVQTTRIAEAKEWCERLASKLEQWRSDHGHYPEDIDGTELVTDAPWLCDSRSLYRLNEDETFVLETHTGPGSTEYWTYSSRDGSWK